MRPVMPEREPGGKVASVKAPTYQRVGAMAKVEVRSEINANVWQVLVAPGEAVEQDQDLLVLESMKMEIPVPSPCAGAVAEVCVAEKDAVSELQLLVLIEG